MKERAEVCGEQIGNDGGKLVAVDIDDQLLEMSEVIEWNEFVSVVFEAKIAKGFGARKEKEFEVLTATGSSDVKADEMEFGARTGRRSAKFAFEGFEMFYDGLGSLGFLKRELGVRVEPFVWIAVNASIDGIERVLTKLLI